MTLLPQIDLQLASFRGKVLNTTLVSHTSSQMPDPPHPGQRLSGPGGTWSIGTFLESSHMEFLRSVLLRESSCLVADDIVAALCLSTLHQYQPCWQSFQSIISSGSGTTVSQYTILDYLLLLFHFKVHSVPMISCHLAAIEDPLEIAFGLIIDSRLKKLFRRGLFLQRPPPRVTCPRWSLQPVLA